MEEAAKKSAHENSFMYDAEELSKTHWNNNDIFHVNAVFEENLSKGIPKSKTDSKRRSDPDLSPLQCE